MAFMYCQVSYFKKYFYHENMQFHNNSKFLNAKRKTTKTKWISIVNIEETGYLNEYIPLEIYHKFLEANLHLEVTTSTLPFRQFVVEFSPPTPG